MQNQAKPVNANANTTAKVKALIATSIAAAKAALDVRPMGVTA